MTIAMLDGDNSRDGGHISLRGMSVLGSKQVLRGILGGNGLVVIEFVRLLGGGVARCEDVVFEH